MNLRKLFREGLYWATLQRGLGLVVSIVTFVFLIKLLPPNAFGVIAYAHVVIVLVEILIHHGLPDAIIQRETITERDLNLAFWFCFLLGATMTVVVFLYADPLATLLKEPLLSPVLKWLSVDFFFVGLSYVPKCLLRREVSYKKISLISLTTESIGGVIAVILAFSGFGIFALVARNLIDEILKSLFFFRWAPWTPGFRIGFSNVVDLYSFALPNMASRYMGYLRDRLDDLIIGYFLGTAALGLYNVAFRCFIYLKTLLIRPGRDVSFPVFSKKQSHLEELREFFTQTLKLQTLVAFPVFITITAVSSEFFSLFFGPTWQVTGILLGYFGVIGLVETLVFYHESLLMAKDRPDLRLLIRTLKVLLNTTIVFILVDKGLLILTIGLVGAEIIQLPVLIQLANKILGLPLQTYLRSLRKPLVISVGLGMMLVLLSMVEFRGALFSLSVKFLSTACFLALIGEFWLLPELRELRDIYFSSSEA